MRVFVTGATGFVGSAVVAELLASGHEVLGLARSDASAAQLAQMGADVLRGTIQDHDALRRGASEADGVAHLAFNHDFSKFAQNVADDAGAIETIGVALEGSGRPLIVTSGLALQPAGPIATESDNPGPHFPRRSEAAAAAAAAKGVRASAVRLPPSTHGKGDHGFVPTLINIAREKGVAAYVGDGQNRWSATHRADAARVFRLALERGGEGGPFHAVAEESIPFRQIAEAIGKGLNLPVVSVAPNEAEAHFGWFAAFAAMDLAASSARTRALLDWTPIQPDLLTDMAQNGYFDA
jgi:nucleoside-diphosphate-sugar epimerase